MSAASTGQNSRVVLLVNKGVDGWTQFQQV